MELGLEGELAVYNRRGGARKQFKFDRVFGPDASQAGVYEDTKFLIRSVLDGARGSPLQQRTGTALHAAVGAICMCRCLIRDIRGTATQAHTIPASLLPDTLVPDLLSSGRRGLRRLQCVHLLLRPDRQRQDAHDGRQRRGEL